LKYQKFVQGSWIAVLFLAGTLQVLGADNAPPTLFQQKCVLCHGTGQGNAAMSKMLHVEPAKMDLTQLKISDEDIRKTITKGKDKMPAFGYLTQPQIKDLVDYIDHLRASSSATTANPPKKDDAK
jgi:mono/diheme cytochrome c family protein